MSSFVDLDDEWCELAGEIARRLGLSRREAIIIALALLASRMRVPIVEDK